MSNGLGSVIYLYTFRTKYSKHVFQDEDFVRTIHRLFRQTAEEKGFEILCCGIATDHVHIILRHDKRHRSGWVMKCIKGASARRFFLMYPDVKMDLRSNSLWTPKYDKRYLATGEDVERAIWYIEGQWTSDGLDKRYRDGVELKASGGGVDGTPTFSRVFGPNSECKD